jgi:hypothetical protein
MKDPVQAKPQVQAKAQAKSAPKAQYKAAADKELPEKSAMDVAMHLAMDDAEATRLPGKDVSAD